MPTDVDNRYNRVTDDAIRFLGYGQDERKSRYVHLGLQRLLDNQLDTPTRPLFTAALACVFGAMLGAGLTIRSLAASGSYGTEEKIREMCYHQLVYPIVRRLGPWLANNEGAQTAIEYEQELIRVLLAYVKAELERASQPPYGLQS
jgi:hypothetical protein